MIPGVQASSFRPLLMTEEQMRTTFQKIREMGCGTVQLQWIDRSIPVSAIASALRATGLASVSAQDFYESIRASKDYYISLNRETGGRWLCVSRIPDRLRSLPGLDQYISELRALQAELDPWGQSLCLHPVGADFEPIEGINPVEYLLDRMPELDLCLDLYHLNRRGLSLTGWIRKYAPRVRMVHFKDEKDGQLVPAGQGEIDWRGVVSSCIEANVPYGFVEQETWDRNPFDCLREGLDWLKGELNP